MSIRVDIGAVWSSWFGTEDTHSTDGQLAAIIEGNAPLPPDARFAYGIDGASDGPVKVTIQVDGPDGHSQITFDPTGDKHEAKEGDAAAMQGQEHGWFKRSRGWNGIVYLFPRKSGPNTATVLVTDQTGETGSFTFPWVAKG